MHPEHHVGRHATWAKALHRIYGSNPDTLYTDAADYPAINAKVAAVADWRELGGDERVYRFNESKCLSWLTKRTKAVAAALESADIQVGAACVSAALVRSKRDSRPTNEDYMTAAHSIVADYVPPALGSALKSSLGLDKKPANDKVKKAENKEDAAPSSPPHSPPAKKKKGEKVEPLEDYTQGTPKNGPTKVSTFTYQYLKIQDLEVLYMDVLTQTIGQGL
ncbi:hypothetical protein HPB48_006079 [Haemaphysalis longicornis]|uniref:Ribonuclease H2 subunit B wHTH domain-containing protein n=1 Tax=Haemaphysalis longicornis TaxID=44386 RepID=A0A9J6G907_HAELO|nr:hypothetical protein HPB48_006079 [Haemaphysalis longicornis]